MPVSVQIHPQGTYIYRYLYIYMNSHLLQAWSFGEMLRIKMVTSRGLERLWRKQGSFTRHSLAPADKQMLPLLSKHCSVLKSCFLLLLLLFPSLYGFGAVRL